jgi:hypothetical protein
MKIVEKYLKNDNVISLEYIGVYPTKQNEIDDVYKTIKKLKDQYQCKRFIISWLKATYYFSSTNIYALPDRLKKSYIDDIDVGFVFDLKSETFKNVKLALAELNTQVFFGNNQIRANTYSDFESALNAFRNIKNP